MTKLSTVPYAYEPGLVARLLGTYGELGTVLERSLHVEAAHPHAYGGLGLLRNVNGTFVYRR